MCASFSPPRPKSVFTTQRKERTTLPIATALTRLLENRRPKMPLIRKPASGRIGMSQSCIGSWLVLHRIDFVDVQSPAIPEHGQDNRQPYRGLRRRHHHHEKREQVARHIFVMVGKSYEAQVDGVQHQLNRHEYRDDIAPEQEA